MSTHSSSSSARLPTGNVNGISEARGSPYSHDPGKTDHYRPSYMSRPYSSNANPPYPAHQSYPTDRYRPDPVRQTPHPLRPQQSPSPSPSIRSQHQRHVHFVDDYAPSGITLKLKLGPRERPTIEVKISIIFEAGKLPRIKVRTRKPRERRRAERRVRQGGGIADWDD